MNGLGILLTRFAPMGTSEMKKTRIGMRGWRPLAAYICSPEVTVYKVSDEAIRVRPRTYRRKRGTMHTTERSAPH